MGKSVLYISYDGMTDPLGQSQVLPYLKGLAQAGHRLSIVSAEKPARFTSGINAVQRQLVNPTIRWHPVAFSNRIPGLSAWLNYRRLRHTCLKLSRDQHFDLIHTRSDIPAIIGLELKKKFGARLLFDMRGFWADERVDGGTWNLANPAYRIAHYYFKRKETEILRSSDSVVTLTHKAKAYLLKQAEPVIPEEKVAVIPCSADLDLFNPDSIDPNDQAEARTSLGIEERDLVLSYSGSLGTWYLLDEMLRFFGILLTRQPQSKFLFITHDDPKKIKSRVKHLGIPAGKIIITSAEREKMPLLLSLSHLSIFFIKGSFSKLASSPTKMGEVLAMGIPLIGNSGVGDVKEIMTESGAGICIDDFSDQSLHQAAEGAMELLSMSKNRIREAAEKFFSLKHGINEYRKIYQTL
jgi:glycosyltransferase involved in cell wall biosynthesis